MELFIVATVDRATGNTIGATNKPLSWELACRERTQMQAVEDAKREADYRGVDYSVQAYKPTNNTPACFVKRTEFVPEELPQLTPVEGSSLVKAILYIPEHQVLYAVLKTTAYKYTEVTQEDYDKLMSYQSIGKGMNAVIIDKKPCDTVKMNYC